MSGKPSFYNKTSNILTSQNTVDKSCCQCKCASYEVANVDLLKVKEEFIEKSTVTNLIVKENAEICLDLKVKDDLNVVGETCLENKVTIKPPCGSTSTGNTVITNNSMDISGSISINTDSSNNIQIYKDTNINANLMVQCLKFVPYISSGGILDFTQSCVQVTTEDITSIIGASEGLYVIIINDNTSSSITIDAGLISDGLIYTIDKKHSSSMIYYNSKLYPLHGTKH